MPSALRWVAWLGIMSSWMVTGGALAQSALDDDLCGSIRTRNSIGLFVARADGTVVRHNPSTRLQYQPNLRLFAIIPDPGQRRNPLRVAVIRSTTTATRSTAGGRRANQDIYVSRGAIRNTCDNSTARTPTPSRRFVPFASYNESIADPGGRSADILDETFHFQVTDPDVRPPAVSGEEAPCFRTDSTANRRDIFTFEWVATPRLLARELAEGVAPPAQAEVVPRAGVAQFASLTTELVETPSSVLLCVPITLPIPTYDGRLTPFTSRYDWALEEAARWRPQETLIRVVGMRYTRGSRALADYVIRWR